MLDTDEVIKNILKHDEDYDPVKAHEYYLRTRELKGRQGGGSAPLPGGEGRTLDTSKIYGRGGKGKKEKKKADPRLEALRNQQRQELEKFQENAKAQREKIQDSLANLTKALSDKLKEENKKTSENVGNAMVKINAERDAKLKRISDAAEARINSLPTLSRRAGPAARAARAKAIEQIRKGAGDEANAVVGGAKAEFDKVQKDASALAALGSERASESSAKLKESTKKDIEKVNTKLKASVESARTKYETLKKSLVDNS